jgi:hypothetical protein
VVTTSATTDQTTEQPLKIEDYPVKQPGWILPVLVGAIVLMVLTALVVVVKGFGKK